MAEKYFLNWDTFSEHLKLMFHDLYQNGRYTDVTLVSDDQSQFKAHKIVLSACSPVFKKIIDSNPSQHPLIYLRGIQSYEMESILQFMYLGEGKFYHERMREFIKVAQDLEVKEISGCVELPSEEAEKTVEENNIPEQEIEEDLIEETPIKAETTIVQQIEPRTLIPNDNKSTQCPECGAEYKQRGHMLLHYRSKHEGVRYPCNQCDYEATQKSNLKAHLARHSDSVMKCDLCDFQTKWKSHWKSHYNSHIRSHT